VNLLQTFGCSDFRFANEIAFEKRICLFLALSVNTVVAICESVKKFYGFVIGKMLGKRNNTITIKDISQVLFSIRSHKFETVSGAHKLILFFDKFTL
jgi:hypothetical protein